MKWRSHKISTLAVVYALSASLPAAVIAAIASIFPDWIEGNGYTCDPGSAEYKRWQARHRKTSHWFVIYSLLAAACFAYAFIHGIRGFAMDALQSNLKGLAALVIGWFCVGCLGHIGEDMICGTVPGFTLHERVGWKFFYVGTMKEYMIVAVIVAVSLVIIFMRSDPFTTHI